MIDHGAMWKLWLTTCALFFAVATPSWALDGRLKAGLLKLDPDTRLEQRCDAEALDRIARDDGNPYRPDRVVAYVFKTPQMKGDTIESPGAAFRANDRWYHLAYSCSTAHDRMQVLSFHYKIGDPIAQEDWSKYNLWQ